jgi:hypothetical protein
MSEKTKKQHPRAAMSYKTVALTIQILLFAHYLAKPSAITRGLPALAKR